MNKIGLPLVRRLDAFSLRAINDVRQQYMWNLGLNVYIKGSETEKENLVTGISLMHG